MAQLSEGATGNAVIVYLTQQLHDYTYAGPYVTGVGLYLRWHHLSWWYDGVKELEFPLFVLDVDDLYRSPVTVAVLEPSLLSLPDH